MAERLIMPRGHPPSGRRDVAGRSHPEYRTHEQLHMDRPMARLLPATLLVVASLFAGPALANEFCDKELAPMIEQRKALTAKLTAAAKRAKEDGSREQFCGTLTAYIGNIQK